MNGGKKMNDHDKIQLREPSLMPTNTILEEVLGDSYVAYEAFQDALPNLEIEQDWQWYTPYKAWFAKGQHWWTTKRGTQKEKTLYWLYVFEGYFRVAVWFKEKNRTEVLMVDVNEKTKQLIFDAKPKGKMPTFPVVFEITTVEPLTDIYTLLDCKKKLEK